MNAIRFASMSRKNEDIELKIKRLNPISLIDKILSYDDTILDIQKSLIFTRSILFEKKIVFCGDSFTAGDFNGYVDSSGKTGIESDAYDPIEKMYKTYPWWIFQRTGCNKIMKAAAGYKLTNNATTSFTNPNSIIYYQSIPTDADYIVIQFGLNDAAYSFGEIDSTDNTTWNGALNEVLNYITLNIPNAKILIIASDAWMTYAQRNVLKESARSWGVGFLDLKDISFPLMINGKYTEDMTQENYSLKEIAKTRADEKYKVTTTNSHPNVLAHKDRSFLIQKKLEELN